MCKPPAHFFQPFYVYATSPWSAKQRKERKEVEAGLQEKEGKAAKQSTSGVMECLLHTGDTVDVSNVSYNQHQLSSAWIHSFAKCQKKVQTVRGMEMVHYSNVFINAILYIITKQDWTILYFVLLSCRVYTVYISLETSTSV